MEHKRHLDPDDLDRPDWNDLKSNYSKHDVGEAYLIGRMHQIGLQVEHWGIDERENDDHLIFDNKMDLRLWEPMGDHSEPLYWPSHESQFDVTVAPEVETATDGGIVHTHEEGDREWQLRGVCDVKTKANRDWLGIFNLRHLAHYAHWAEEYDVPVFLYFTMVDMDAEKVGEENIIIPIEPFDHYYDYVRHFDHDNDDYIDVVGRISEDCPIAKRAFGAPDGNPVVVIDEDHFHDFDYVVEEVL